MNAVQEMPPEVLPPKWVWVDFVGTGPARTILRRLADGTPVTLWDSELFELLTKKQEDGHWIWEGPTGASDLPYMTLEIGSQHRATHVALALAKRPLPLKRKVPGCPVYVACVNPSHVRPGATA